MDDGFYGFPEIFCFCSVSAVYVGFSSYYEYIKKISNFFQHLSYAFSYISNINIKTHIKN